MMHLTKEQVDTCFEGCTHQAEAMVNLYRLVYPDWNLIKKLHSWPKCGKELATYIAKSFMAFDRKHHPKVMPGGLWMNNGWSTLDNDYLGPWEVDSSKGEPEYSTMQDVLEDAKGLDGAEYEKKQKVPCPKCGLPVSMPADWDGSRSEESLCNKCNEEAENGNI